MPSWIDGSLYPDTETSIAYHLVREWYDLPELPFLGQKLPEIANDPNLAYI